jgi:hypothetical protein
MTPLITGFICVTILGCFAIACDVSLSIEASMVGAGTVALAVGSAKLLSRN